MPYGTFSPDLPLQIKIGFWPTDLPEAKMGNLVVLPGSHREQYIDEYDSHEPIDGEQVVTLKKGTMTLMHSSIWHRVLSDPAWLETLNREQRIIMHSYDNAYSNAKPPASDFPLFLDRETGLDRDPNAYRDDVKLHRRKRRTWAERKKAAAAISRSA